MVTILFAYYIEVLNSPFYGNRSVAWQMQLRKRPGSAHPAGRKFLPFSNASHLHWYDNAPDLI